MSASGARLPDLDDLYENAACGLLLTREDGTILRANATFCHWTGYAAADLTGVRRLQDLLTRGGQIYHQTHWAPLLHMQGAVAEIKLDVVRSDGEQVPMLMNALRRADDAAGAVHRIAVFLASDRHKYEQALVIARRQADESLRSERQAQGELRDAQAKLRLALDSAQLLVWEAGLDDGRRHYEDGVARLLGLESPRPISQARFAAAIHPDDRAAEAQAFADARSDPERGYQAVYRLRGDDGIERVIRSTGRAKPIDSGSGGQLIGVLQDITDAVRQRAAAEDRALLAEQMVGIVSHDLRNPLAVITMSETALSRGDATPAQQSHLQRIARSAARAHRLIGDLLDFTVARIGPGIPVAPRTIDLHQVVAAAVDELRSAYPGRVIDDSCVGEGECSADADRLAQVIGNLVSNAIQYGDPDAPIGVASSIDDDTFAIQVHNTGSPIEAELLPSLFKPVMQKRGERAKRSVGLGLYIVREIVRAHGGSVTVDSAPASGTTFCARFPRPADGGGGARAR